MTEHQGEQHDHDHEHGDGHDHAHDHPHAAPVGASRRASPAPIAAPSNWDPFERVYTPTGGIDRDYASKRLPILVEMLRRNPACYQARIDIARLGAMLIEPTSTGLREAADQETFESELRKFSEARLHELVDAPMQNELGTALMTMARDEKLTRRDRAAAALGVALLSLPPDALGLRGRGMMDLVLRVTMEEQTAQETMRKKAREAEDGIPAEELTAFWQQYPALRWHHEEHYRRGVTHVLKAIEKDEMPAAVSVDLGLRGASKLLGEVAAARAAGKEIDSHQAEAILREPFVHDMMDGGADLVVARWRADMARVDDVKSAERRAILRSLEMGARLVEEQGPGSEAILFYLYLRAVVQGHYFVRDEAELEAAKAVFAPGGLIAEGAITYAAHLAGLGDSGGERRVLLAAFELWPDNAEVRAKAEAAAARHEAELASTRLGPKYEDARKDERQAAADESAKA